MIEQQTIRVGDGPALRVVGQRQDGPDIMRVRSSGAMQPDLAWVAVDEYGHEHRWAEGAREARDRSAALPSLTPSRVHVECDGSCAMNDCEGYDRTVWHCVLCGDEVEPGYVPDWHARTVGTAIVTSPARFLYEVQVPDVGEVRALGEIHRPVRATLSDGEHEVDVQLVGTGEAQWRSDELPQVWVELLFDVDQPMIGEPL